MNGSCSDSRGTRAPKLHWPKLLTILIFSLALIATPHLLAEEDPNGQCLMCHEDKSLNDSAGRSLFVDKAKFDQSIHGKSGIGCVSCHNDLESVKDFPHAEKLAKVDCATCHESAQKQFEASVHFHSHVGNKAREVTCVSCHGVHDILEKSDVGSRVHPLSLPQTCGSCHFSEVNGKKGQGFVLDYLESVHGRALRKTGLSISATCATCHGAHDIKRTSDSTSLVSRGQVPNTCGKCHTGIVKDYLAGVHGKDFSTGMRDVPVCTDCHGEHNILSPQNKKSKVYATQVALTCAKCHDSDELAQKYALPPARMRTFQGTFHGIASMAGEAKVANCVSCHGFHNIRPSSDPRSSIHPANLPQTCGQCHRGAGEKLAQAKIHVLDIKTTNYAVYVVQRFYYYLILMILGSFVLYILADLNARRRRRTAARS